MTDLPTQAGMLDSHTSGSYFQGADLLTDDKDAGHPGRLLGG